MRVARTRLRLAVWIVCGTLLVMFAGFALAASWLVYTESGLAWLATRVAGIAGKGLTLDGVAGTLAHGASIEHIRYAGKDIELHVTSASLRLAPASLLKLKPRIEGLRAAQIAVVTKPGEPRGRPPDTLELPVDFELVDARVTRLVLDLGEGPLELSHIRLEYDGGRTRHRADLSLDALDYAVAVRGQIGAAAPFPLHASVAAVRRESPQGSAYAAVRGDLSEIRIDGGAVAGRARVEASAEVKPYEALPLSALTAQLSALDLHALSSGLPETVIDGKIGLKRAGALYGGSLQLTNAAHGTYDQNRLPIAALRASLQTDTTKARLSELVVDLGAAGVITGSGELEATRAQLALVTKRLNLQRLYGKLRETALAGRADIELQRDRQSVKAALTQSDIALELTAHRVGDAVDVPQFRASARGGELKGEAHLSLAARRAFSARAAFARFDPAAWGDFPAGSINGTLVAEGALAPTEAAVKFAIADSRWLGAPLSARGAVHVADNRLFDASLEAALGGNRFSAQGALGAARDTLVVRVNAPRLAVIHKDVQGALRGTVQLSGAWRTPNLRFDMTGEGLAYRSLGRVKALAARGLLHTHGEGPFELDATLHGITAPQGELESASIVLNGTRAAHTVLVQARGYRVDFRARARGAWKGGSGWSGTLQELVNRGEVPVELVNPVAVIIGPRRAYAQAFELRVVGGHLSVSELDYQQNHLSTSGRFSGLPVAPLVTLAGVPAQAAGTLRLSGQWALNNVPHLAGSITVTRESGDLGTVADKSLRVGLQTLALDARFAAQGATVQMRVRSALANAHGEGRIDVVGGRYTGASPVALDAEVSIAQLAPFASLIDTTMLISGEARARVQVRGTLGDPLITGPITADKLAIALPADGVDLKGGTLRAMLTEREVRVESFSISGGQGEFTARGTLARKDFSEASVDWRAERFTVLARPDRRLIVSGRGNASLKSGKVAFTGTVRADEGYFELVTTALPTLGEDVVVVGRGSPKEQPTAEPRKLPRAIVDVAIDLGNKVHIHGRGLDVWLSGTMRVQTDSQGALSAHGTVDARRGTFVAYGQRLEIQRGLIYFNGPISNPGLDIVAMRTRQAVEAGVAITGTLTNPLVRVVSNPALPEGEALSWLVLGRAPDAAGAGQLSALPLATGALMGRAGKPLASALHLDEISLRGSSSVSEQFLTVGKRVTDRIYVVFEQSLGGAENLLRLEMSLTQRISVRAQAGETSLIGLFYRYAWD